ncbi:MAG: hypothetical protein KQH57_07975 [Actinomycetales bacterium]|nr:hypothetical protein [Actinomycetales bacterium]
MQHVVPEKLEAALRASGLRVAGPLDTRAGRPRWTALGPDGQRWTVLEVAPSHAPAARLRAKALAEVEHPHLAVGGPVLDLPDGGVLALVAAEPGVDLAVLLGARGPLDDAEAVGVLAPVAEALAALHAAGLTHGGLTGGDVVLTDSGPVLADVGGGAGPGGAPDVLARQRSEDVADLIALGRRLLGPAAAGPVADALDGPDDGADALAARLRSAAPPRPVDLPDAAVLARLALLRLSGDGPVRGRHEDDSRRRRGPARRARRRLRRAPRGVRVAAIGVAALVAVLGGATWLGVLPWATASPPGTPSAGAMSWAARTQQVPSSEPSDVIGPAASAATGPDGAGTRTPGTAEPQESADDVARAEAVRLTRERITAMAAGEADRLAELTEPGSPAAAADVGLTLVPVELADLHVEASEPVTYGCPPDVVCVPVVAHVRTAGGEEQVSSVTLALRPGTWRVVSVSPGR